MNRRRVVVQSVLTDSRATVLTAIAAVLIFNGITGCDESLPPRGNPSELFSARISGHYIYSQTANGIGITVSIVNAFDETFQETALLDGYVQFIWQRNPSLRKTLSMQGLLLTYARNFDHQTGILTIDPGDSVTFFYFWDLNTDSNEFIPEQFSYYTYLRCNPLRMQSEPEYFTLVGNVRMFEKTGITTFGPTTFTLCSYGDRYMDVRVCPGSPGGAPCP